MYVCDEVGDYSCDVRTRVVLLKCDVTSTNLQEREDGELGHGTEYLSNCH